jgi:rhodanese-related sulfurtransferase
MPRSLAPRAAAALLLLGALVVTGCAPQAAADVDTAASDPASVTAGSGQVSALPAEVAVDEASRLRDAGAFVLDVRQPEEWAAGHIPDATLIPLGELASRIAEVPADRQVVVVCRSGNRSAQGRDILLGAGHASVTSMAGGMNDWTAAGYPTTTGG